MIAWRLVPYGIDSNLYANNRLDPYKVVPVDAGRETYATFGSPRILPFGRLYDLTNYEIVTWTLLATMADSRCANAEDILGKFYGICV